MNKIWVLLFALVAMANAFTISYNYSGATGASCYPASTTGETEIVCNAPSGYTWATAAIKGAAKNSAIKYCNVDFCSVAIAENVTIEIGFEKSENVHKISWTESGYGWQNIEHGQLAVTDIDETKFVLSASAGDSVKLTPMPVEKYHFKQFYNTGVSPKVKVGESYETYTFEMPETDVSFEAEFDYNLYGIYADMNGSSETYFLRTCSVLAECVLWKDSAKYEGHIFQGWTLERDALDTFFIPGAVFWEPLSIVQMDSVIMYAKWFEAKIPKKVNGCYQIGNENELYGFSYLVSGKDGYEVEQDACGELTADIVVNKKVLTETDSLRKDTDHLLYWVPIGTSASPFKGKFNGKGHTISGLYLKNASQNDVGLFGMVQGNVSIDSVGLLDSYFEGNDYVGGLVGRADTRAKISINYSYTDMALSGSAMGGLIGKVSDTSNVKISHSYRKGNIFSKGGAIGGLIGSIGSASVVSISNSHNESPIFNGSNGGSMGGLVGGFGTVCGEDVIDDTLDSLIIDSSYNTGTIDGEKNDSYYGISRNIGGLVGAIHANHAFISNSYNTASMSLVTAERNINTIGGLVGWLTGSLEISRSHNTGDLYGSYVGGLVGQTGDEALYADLRISMSYNEGYLQGTQDVAGLLGAPDVLYSKHIRATVVNSYNVGKVELYDTFYKKLSPGGGFFSGYLSINIINSYNMSEFIYGVCHISYDTLTNVFYPNRKNCKDEPQPKNSLDEFANGSIATLLYNYKGDGVDGHVWGQRVGVDPYPVLNGAGVEGYEGGRTVASVKVSPVNLSVAVDGRKVNVAGARVGDRIAVFDLQGKAVPGFDSHVTSGNFELTMPRTGRYLLMVGKRVMPVTVK